MNEENNVVLIEEIIKYVQEIKMPNDILLNDKLMREYIEEKTYDHNNIIFTMENEENLWEKEIINLYYEDIINKYVDNLITYELKGVVENNELTTEDCILIFKKYIYEAVKDFKIKKLLKEFDNKIATHTELVENKSFLIKYKKFIKKIYDLVMPVIFGKHDDIVIFKSYENDFDNKSNIKNFNVNEFFENLTLVDSNSKKQSKLLRFPFYNIFEKLEKYSEYPIFPIHDFNDDPIFEYKFNYENFINRNIISIIEFNLDLLNAFLNRNKEVDEIVLRLEDGDNNDFIYIKVDIIDMDKLQSFIDGRSNSTKESEFYCNEYFKEKCIRYSDNIPYIVEGVSNSTYIPSVQIKNDISNEAILSTVVLSSNKKIFNYLINKDNTLSKLIYYYNFSIFAHQPTYSPYNH